MGNGELLNDRIAGIAPSVTLAITSRAKAMSAKGRPVCSFAAGEPDFDTPEPIKAVAIKALEAGETKYAPVAGLPALRSAIAAKLAKDNGLHYDAAQIVVSNGGKQALFNVFMALCREGDEIVIPAPYWLSYPEMVRVAGGKPVFVSCPEDNDFKLTPAEFENAITDRTKAVVINSPSNPLGIVYTREELEALAEVAVNRGIHVVSDEMYEKMVYDGTEHVSIGSFSKEILERTITVNGFSKAYSMTGWRLGYAAGPAKLMSAVSSLQSHSTSGANTFAQHGAVAALAMPSASVNAMVSAFDGRRQYIYERITAIEGLSCVRPMGAFYVFPSIARLNIGSVAFAERLLEEAEVAVVPGLPFGSDKHIRLSYACSMENIREGMDRIEKFVGAL